MEGKYGGKNALAYRREKREKDYASDRKNQPSLKKYGRVLKKDGLVDAPFTKEKGRLSFPYKRENGASGGGDGLKGRNVGKGKKRPHPSPGTLGRGTGRLKDYAQSLPVAMRGKKRHWRRARPKKEEKKKENRTKNRPFLLDQQEKEGPPDHSWKRL